MTEPIITTISRSITITVMAIVVVVTVIIACAVVLSNKAVSVFNKLWGGR